MLENLLCNTKILIKLFLFVLYIKFIIQNDIEHISLAIYTYGLKGGGTERVTALLLNYLSKVEIFQLYVFSQRHQEDNEFIIPENIERIYIDEENTLEELPKRIEENRIDILIYQFPHGDEINILNTLKNVKIIIYSHFCFLTWIYFYDIHYFKILYNSYKESKYIIYI